ncbi:hypothetical protein ACKI16_29715 [Streptomyces scabiei]|uniref:hypothetical protein n=1 Tax=Streptomyces scabiei TaxID=1930 RepID=UPI0038F5F3D9
MNFATATETEVRDFLRLCLEPRPGHTRPPEALAQILPGPLRENLHQHAPNLSELRADAERAALEAGQTADRYAGALAAWITGDHSTHDRDHIDGVPWPQCLTCSTETHTVDWTVPDRPPLCTQNGEGDAATPRPHVFAAPTGGPVRCLFCAVPADGVEAGYRTPDGRVWTLSALLTDDGTPLYEAPFVGACYTAVALHTLHGDTEPVREVQAPPYVHNARNVNRRPGTAVKHIPDGHGNTICPRALQATAPMPAEEAARLPLCKGCRDAALTAAGLPTA